MHAISASRTIPRIQRVAQSVAQEIERKQRGGEEGGREQQRPWGGLEFLRTFVDQGTPGRQRLLHAQAEKAEKGFDQNRDFEDSILGIWGTVYLTHKLHNTQCESRESSISAHCKRCYTG